MDDRSHYLAVWKKGFAALCGWSEMDTTLWAASSIADTAFLITRTPMWYIARELVEQRGMYDSLAPRMRDLLIEEIAHVLAAGVPNGWDFHDEFNFAVAKIKINQLLDAASRNPS